MNFLILRLNKIIAYYNNLFVLKYCLHSVIDKRLTFKHTMFSYSKTCSMAFCLIKLLPSGKVNCISSVHTGIKVKHPKKPATSISKVKEFK